MHVDLDAFFVAVQQARNHDRRVRLVVPERALVQRLDVEGAGGVVLEDQLRRVASSAQFDDDGYAPVQ